MNFDEWLDHQHKLFAYVENWGDGDEAMIAELLKLVRAQREIIARVLYVNDEEDAAMLAKVTALEAALMGTL